MNDIKNEFKNKLEEFENAGSFLVTRSEIMQFITTIESQKEEIEKLELDLFPEWIQRRDELQMQINSLKAITELTVKGLKEIACLNVDSAYSAGTIARNTFSEIERLSCADLT